MAFLLPENIPSRSGVTSRLRQVAGALRDHAPDDVTVWLRETMGGLPYLIVLDPGAGIILLDAPSLSAAARRRRGRGRVFDSFDALDIPTGELTAKAADLDRDVDVSAIENLPVKCVLAVPDLDEVPLERLSDADRDLPMLTRTDLSEAGLMPAIRRILGGERPRPLTDQEEKRARAVVNPKIILPSRSTEQLPLFNEPEIAPEDVIRVMDREQERLAEHLHWGYRVIRGVAGSGKTLVLAHRALHLHQRWPDWRILVLCYNVVLSSALQRVVGSDERLEVTNIDRLARRLADRTGLGGSTGPSGRAASADNRASGGESVFDRRVRKAKNVALRLPDSERFDAVLVDEAQDFDHPRLDLAYSLLKSDRLRQHQGRPDRDNFMMAYDVAQNVYRGSGARWSPPGVDAQGRSRTARGRSTVFRTNYRNTRETLEFAMNFLTGSRDWSGASVDLDDPAALIPPEAAKRSGPLPKLTDCHDPRDEAEAIACAAAAMVEGGVAVEDIVVMYGCPGLESDLRRAFSSHQSLGYFHVQERDARGWQTNRDRAVHVRDKVRVSTLTGIKGLDFSRVLIGGVNQIRVPDLDEQDQFRAAKSHLYVAMTRAMDELVITMSGDGPIGRALREAERLQRVD